MLNIETQTKLSPEEAMKRAMHYFQGFKMTASDQTPNHVFFEGGGGSVELSICQEKGITKLDFISREWDSPVKDFITALPQKVKY